MSDIAKRFSDSGKRVIAFAVTSAGSLGHTYVGSEHLLLGLLALNGTPKKLFNDFGCDYENVRSKIIGIVGMGCQSAADSEDMTPMCKKILIDSCEFAKETGSGFAEPEHIMMSLLKRDCVASRLVSNMNVPLDELLMSLNGSFSENGISEIKCVKTRKPTPLLDRNAFDLTEKARKGLIDPVIGREKEENRVINILLRRSKNNPCLIGEAGVGKTAVAEAIALRIAEKRVPSSLLDTRIMSLELSSVVAGTKYRGEFEEKIKGIIDECRNNDGVILFIDEIHTIVGAGAAEGAIDASNILKPALARGEIRLIGATTPKEYKQSIEHDGALERRFQPVNIEEPTEKECIKMLFGIRKKYEEFHGIAISDEAVKACVSLSKRYINGRFLPDKAIDLLDESAARKKAENSGEEKITLGERDIMKTVEDRTGIPMRNISDGNAENVFLLEEKLNSRVIGQKDAVKAISEAALRSFCGVRDENCPCASFLFVGHGGVGKTECAKALADIMFSGGKSFVRLDMGEYTEPYSVSKLTGAPPGYKGFSEGGYLTERIRRNPYSLILFDGIEKAHGDIKSLLLSILDEGKLTDASGLTVSFRDTVIIMTVNIPDSFSNSIGFSDFSDENAKKEKALAEALKLIPSAISEKIGEKIFFSDLSDEALKTIAEKKLSEFVSAMREKGIDAGYDARFIENVFSKLKTKSAFAVVNAVTRAAEETVSKYFLRSGDKKSSEKIFFSDSEREYAKIEQKTY